MTGMMYDAQAVMEDFLKFFRRYYHEDILQIAQAKRDHPSLYIEFKDFYTFDADLADDWLASPEEFRELAEEALAQYDVPLDVSMAGINVRMTDSHEYIDPIDVPGLQSSEYGTYVAVRGQVNKITEIRKRIVTAEFECQKCGANNTVPQTLHQFSEPLECSCERQGPFRLRLKQSEKIRHLKIQLKQPPEEAHNGSGQKTTVYVDGDLIDYGGQDGLQGHAGERAIVYGVVTADTSDLTNSKKRGPPEYVNELEGHAIRFTQGSTNDIDYESHREEIRELADGVEWDIPDYIDIAPHHPAWALAHSLTDLALNERLAQVGIGVVAYLFGSYRMVDSYRGDIHVGLWGDPSTGKSTFAQAAFQVAPMSSKASGPDLSKVGLTAAATRDGFDNDQWSLSPGILPKSNGGHAIVEEIDKMDKKGTDALHDALENPQQVSVSKAGIQATLNTRAALLSTGNPKDGRFNRAEVLGAQIDINDALFTRFDLMFCMWDPVDEERDDQITSHVYDSMQEKAEIERSDQGVADKPDLNVTNPPVEHEMITRWIAASRENCYPSLPDGAVKEKLKEWYMDERQSNGRDPTSAVPITARSFQAGVRLAIAFARVRMADEVELCDVELAIHVSKRVMGDVFLDPTTGEMDVDNVETRKPKSQRDRIRQIRDATDDLDGKDGAPRDDVVATVVGQGYSEDTVEHSVEKMLREGDLRKPGTGYLRTT